MTKNIACPVCGGRGYVAWVNTTDDNNSTGSQTCPHCNGTGIREVAFTNADRIRAMTDEELENVLTDYSNNGGWITEIGREICYERIIEWLKQLAED